MAAAKFDTPALKPYPVIPLVAEGAMAHSKPFVASPKIQEAIGFPGELTEGWEQRAVAKMGELLGKCVNEKLGGNAQVLFGAAPDGTAGKKEYDESALAALAATAPGAKVVQTIQTPDRAKAQVDIGNALQGNPNINAFMSSGDEGPLAALGAFAAAGKELPCDVAGTAGNPETLAAVKAGKIYGVNALQFEADMKQSFDTLVKMQADPTAKGLVLTVPQKIITQSSS